MHLRILELGASPWFEGVVRSGLSHELTLLLCTALNAHFLRNFAFPEITEEQFDQIRSRIVSINMGLKSLSPVFDRGILRFWDSEVWLVVEPLKVGEIVVLDDGTRRRVIDFKDYEVTQSVDLCPEGADESDARPFPYTKEEDGIRWDSGLVKII